MLTSTRSVALQHRCVDAQQPAGPPVARRAFLLDRGKPVLPQHGAYLAWRRSGEGIAGKERQHVRVVGQQALFGSRNQGVLLPRTERGKPEIPLKARLVGGVDSGRPVERLRLEAEGIGDPGLPVARALKLDLVAAPGHHREQTILVGDAKWLQHGHRLHRQGQAAEDHGDQLHRGHVANQREQHSTDRETETSQAARRGWSGSCSGSGLTFTQRLKKRSSNSRNPRARTR